MSRTSAELGLLLRELAPVLNEGTFVFACLPPDADVLALAPVATLREPEGLSVVVEEGRAAVAGVPALFRAAWITLQVPSALDAVGLTAAVSSALAHANISCNIVAGAHHDHLFVPVADAQAAMTTLLALQRSAGG